MSFPLCIFFVETIGGIAMQVQVQKWGNSLALRIPKSFAVESRIEQGALVDLSVVDGKLVVSPVTQKSYTLNELLEGVTKQNIHGETDWGGAIGGEVW
jgi:antitoxin MazE